MENILKVTFWEQLIETAVNWVVTELPGILILTLIMFLAFRVIRFSFKRLRKVLAARADRNIKVDTDETVKRINTLTGILHTIIKIILWAVYLMMVLQKFGINIAPILASAGIIGLAIGFGAQELVRDFISGFFMILENQLRTGDVVMINGNVGLVEKVELRTLTLRDFSGVIHVYQNGKINNVSNMTKDWSAVVFDIGVAYKEKTQLVIDLMKQVGDELSEDADFKNLILEPIEVFGLDKFADSAIVIKARLKTRPGQQWAVGREYRKRLKDVFDAQNIEIPFPHTTLYWGDKIKPLKLEMNDQIIEALETKTEAK
ncbi:MAG: mechanosensitive ion channel family protein [Candidatus Marinimicrobia bacterium]|nr:mechanosensitive ion channel family protein [Candidatus Neomarinimicrobiota bacterium]